MKQVKNILITGTNRGIGLEFVRQYAKQGHNIFATSRDNYRSAELRQLAEQTGSGKIKIFPLEVTDAASRASLKDMLGDTPLDLFINNAGIYGPRSVPISALDESEWLHVFHTNTIAPLKMVDLLKSNLVSATNGATIAVVSTKMGSIADNTSGGSYPYRSSKAAVNCVVKGLAIDLTDDKLKVVALHPGWVKTDMGGPNALIDTQTSVAGMTKVIAELSQQQSGLFINYDGTVLPW